MTPEQFKPALVRDKEFLRQIYSSSSVPNTKRLIVFASDQQLDTVLKLMHFISNGQMRLKKSHFDSFSKAQITLLKKNFEKKATFAKLLKSDRKDKVKLIQKLLPIMHFLLHPLFNRPE